MIDFRAFAQASGVALDFVGIVIILLGAAAATIGVISKYIKGSDVTSLYNYYRWNLARSILVGLEFLVAGDIIRSVGGDLTMDAVIVLAIIVIVRAFLGIEFQMEIEGKWPWQMAESVKKSTK